MIPPHSVEAEQGVLGSMLVSPRDTIAECAEKISPEQFYVPAHRTIYNVLVDLWSAGKAIDLITFTQVLRDRQLLDGVGGAGFVTNLFTFVPTAANVQYYLEIVQEKYVLRQIIVAAAETGRRAYEEQADVDETIAFVAQRFEAIKWNGNGSGLPEIQDVSDLLLKAIDLPGDVIGGLLHKGGKMVIGGGSKSFKTWQLIDMATAVATGTEFLGFPTIAGRVLYINLEIQDGFFSDRVRVIADAKSISLPAGSFGVWNLRGHAAELSTLLPEMIRVAGLDKFSLIIVDPIYKVLGEREENVTHHITAIMNDLERLAVKSGAAVAFGAHFSKGNQAGKESIDRISGSGAFARDPDSILVLTKHEEDNAFTVEATLRNHPPIDPFVVRWKFPLMNRDEQLDPSRLKQAVGRPRAATQTQILDLLTDRPLRAAEWQKRATEEFGIVSSTFYQIKAELQQLNRIESIAGLFSKT